MNSVNYYDCSKLPWNEEETEELKSEYGIHLLNIIEIANIHRRTPGSIAYKLKNIGMVGYAVMARGYEEYKNSTLYNQVVQQHRKEDTEKKSKKDQKKEEKMKIKEEKDSLQKMSKVDLIREILTMKEEISEIKEDIKQILNYMTQIYEFETE